MIRSHVCFIAECDTPGCEPFDDHEYVPHFDTAEEAIARLVAEWGWTNDGALLCPADSARRQCEQTGHDWYDPSLEDPRFERKYCRNCPETRPIRDTATA
ncbi:hypothetical protein [Nocardiopsis dassonvillei]|uniref:hypothetical protein n=1 Tax=Nocardiopsis dassonvillei TaxID=2014 RepID=UPI00157C5F3D|nr:hypothetical protein [Nocardiopsis dassonvillei]